MIGTLLKGLFGGGSKPEAKQQPPVAYQGYEIFVAPEPVNGQWRISGRIEKETDGARQVHIFIRADVLPSMDEAAAQTLRKAKLLIDQQGDGIFN